MSSIESLNRTWNHLKKWAKENLGPSFFRSKKALALVLHKSSQIAQMVKYLCSLFSRPKRGRERKSLTLGNDWAIHALCIVVAVIFGCWTYNHFTNKAFNRYINGYKSANPFRQMLMNDPAIPPDYLKAKKYKPNSPKTPEERKFIAQRLMVHLGLMGQLDFIDGKSREVDINEDGPARAFSRLTEWLEVSDNVNSQNINPLDVARVDSDKSEGDPPLMINFIVRWVRDYGEDSNIGGFQGEELTNEAVKRVVDVLPLVLANAPIESISAPRPGGDKGPARNTAAPAFFDVIQAMQARGCESTYLPNGMVENTDARELDFIKVSTFDSLLNPVLKRSDRPPSDEIVDALYNYFEIKPGSDKFKESYESYIFEKNMVEALLNSLDNAPGLDDSKRDVLMWVGYEQFFLIILAYILSFELVRRVIRLLAESMYYNSLSQQISKLDPKALLEKPTTALLEISSAVVKNVSWAKKIYKDKLNVESAFEVLSVLLKKELEGNKEAGDDTNNRIPLDFEISGIAEEYITTAENSRTFINTILILIPAVGFIGTVRGIMNALDKADIIMQATTSSEQQIAIATVAGLLALSFTTTLLALVINVFGTLFARTIGSHEEKLYSSLTPLFQSLLKLAEARKRPRVKIGNHGVRDGA